MDLALHYAVFLQLAQLLGQHPVGNAVDGAVEFQKPQHRGALEMDKDNQLPASFQYFECWLELNV
jgi:hypothetical protein